MDECEICLYFPVVLTSSAKRVNAWIWRAARSILESIIMCLVRFILTQTFTFILQWVSWASFPRDFPSAYLVCPGSFSFITIKANSCFSSRYPRKMLWLNMEWIGERITHYVVLDLDIKNVTQVLQEEASQGLSKLASSHSWSMLE